MLWRKLKLDWSYAVGELLIVTVGVLIALAIDQWNSDRQDRAEEKRIIERLINDVERDIELADRALRIIEAKLESMSRVKDNLELGIESVKDQEQFVGDFWRSQNYGWGQDRAIQSTFDEITSSGDFSLISSPVIRAEISRYYFFRNIEHERMNERESEFPRIVYRLVPHSVRHEQSIQYFGIPDYDQIVTRIFAFDVTNALRAEMNYAFFAKRDFNAIKRNAEALVQSLKSELNALE